MVPLDSDPSAPTLLLLDLDDRLEEQPVLLDGRAADDEALRDVELHEHRALLTSFHVDRATSELDLDAGLRGARELETDDRLPADHRGPLVVQRDARLRRID